MDWNKHLQWSNYFRCVYSNNLIHDIFYAILKIYWWGQRQVGTGNANLFTALCSVIGGVRDGWGLEMQTYLLPFVLLLVVLGMGGDWKYKLI